MAPDRRIASASRDGLRCSRFGDAPPQRRGASYMCIMMLHPYSLVKPPEGGSGSEGRLSPLRCSPSPDWEGVSMDSYGALSYRSTLGENRDVAALHRSGEDSFRSGEPVDWPGAAMGGEARPAPRNRGASYARRPLLYRGFAKAPRERTRMDRSAALPSGDGKAPFLSGISLGRGAGSLSREDSTKSQVDGIADRIGA